jgi:hypothetical protein
MQAHVVAHSPSASRRPSATARCSSDNLLRSAVWYSGTPHSRNAHITGPRLVKHTLRPESSERSQQWAVGRQRMEAHLGSSSSAAKINRAVDRAPKPPTRLSPRQAWPRVNVREPGTACTSESTEFASATDQLHSGCHQLNRVSGGQRWRRTWLAASKAEWQS